MKKGIIAGVVILLLVAGGLFLFLDNLDAIVKRVIEKAGTAAVETPVTVGGVDIALSEGRAAIRGLAVQNPKGFSDDKAMKFGELMAQIDIKTQVVKKIRVASPVFLFEEKSGQTNFGVLKKTVSAKSKKPKKADESDKDDAAAKEIRIDRVEIENAQIRLVSDKLEKEEQVVMKKMVLTNLHGTSDQVAQQALNQITEKVVAYAARKLAQKKTGQVIEEKAGSGAKSLFDKVMGD